MRNLSLIRPRTIFAKLWIIKLRRKQITTDVIHVRIPIICFIITDRYFTLIRKTDFLLIISVHNKWQVFHLNKQDNNNIQTTIRYLQQTTVYVHTFLLTPPSWLLACQHCVTFPPLLRAGEPVNNTALFAA